MDRLGSLTPGSRSRSKGTRGLELDCPPLPHTLFEAIRLVENPETASHARVVRMVRNDPLVVVRLLRIVNSPYYGFSRKVESTDRAVRLLGPSTVAGIVVGMNVVRLQSTLEGPGGGILSRLVRHGVATGYMASWLWQHVGNSEGGHRAQTAGLLRDFGKFVLVYNYPEEAIKLYEGGNARAEADWRKAERKYFGCTHTEAGRHVAEHLDFPAGLVGIISRTSADPQLEAVVTAADLVVRTFGFWFEQPIRWEECREHLVWDNLADAFPERAGDRESLLEEVRAQKESVIQYVVQLLTRKTGRRSQSASRGKPNRPRKSPDPAA